MEQTTSEKNSNLSFLGKKAPITIAGVILLGIAGSALYDLFVKPGINIFSRFFFNLFTFGSQQVKDYSFNTAALDPTALPSLILLMVLAMVAIDLPLRRLIRVRMRKAQSNESKPRKAKLFIFKKVVLPLIIIIQVAIVFVPLNIFNQAVVTWRVFNSNIAILAPDLSHKEILVFKAEFASMESEQDYRFLEAKLEKVAEDKNLILRSESPW